jgi:hypothetical protein
MRRIELRLLVLSASKLNQSRRLRVLALLVHTGAEGNITPKITGSPQIQAWGCLTIMAPGQASAV